VADTLKQAIDMFPEERTQRMARLQARVAAHNIYKWLADIFTKIDRFPRESSVAKLGA
jgi:trehalose-6-phosphate synthase